MPEPRGSGRLSIVIFVFSLLYAIGLQYLARPYARDGIYFHTWSSEDMMQTVSLKELRHDPLDTLLHIHIQPPAFDALRALLAQLWPGISDQAALVQVDLALYLLGSVMLGLITVIVFRWLWQQSGLEAALLGSFLVLIHPASIYFATYLDSTLLSTLLILLAFQMLWQLAADHSASVLPLSAVVAALFFTRSIFQWPAVILFAASLFLLRVPGRQVARFLLITGLCTGAYLAKQQALFGLLSTSSFAGVNLANSIGVGMSGANYADFLNEAGHQSHVDVSMPAVLTDKTKLNGEPNFNHIDYLYLNNQLLGRYRTELSRMSVGELAREYWENTAIYFKPTSTYSSGHVIVERLPWRWIYDRVFSAPVLPVLLSLAVGIWCLSALSTGSFAKGLGLVLPAVFVLAVSILGDKGENMRFKFFLEPLMIVFLVSQSAAFTRLARGWLGPGRPAG